MKRVALCLALVGLLGLGGQAFALINTIDDVPAATLLLPYFEVDSNDPNGLTTLFSINNASATAVLTHVTVWSDQSVPVLDFDVYLTGFDVITINLRDILINGNLPVTASDGQDPQDTISPQGDISQDINFASCTGVLPYTNPAISTSFRAHLQAWLTGNQSPVTGNCAGARIQDGILRGYVTVDTVNACNLLFPSQLATGYDAFLTDQNVIWGDYFYVNAAQNFAQGETLVHIEACPALFSGPALNCPFAPGDHTFYGRYASATAIDQREALPTTLASRYISGGGFDGGTDFLIWREATTRRRATAARCRARRRPGTRSTRCRSCCSTRRRTRCSRKTARRATRLASRRSRSRTRRSGPTWSTTCCRRSTSVGRISTSSTASSSPPTVTTMRRRG